MKRLLPVLLAVCLFLAASYGAGWLLSPVRDGYGSTWEMYLQEPKNSVDTLFLGTSMVYCDVMPSVMEEETGKRCYVMAGPEQTMPITYYYLREACRSQSPTTVVLELNAMFFRKYENYSMVNITFMPWSANRLAATFRGAETEQWLPLLFPLYAYHDRVYSVTPGELRFHLFPAADEERGYTRLTDAVPQNAVTYRDYSADTDTYRENLEYLQKIADYCGEKGMDLVLYLAPAFDRVPEDARAQLLRDLENVPHAAFFDCNDGSWEEIDPETGWYDNLHYNELGAEIFSRAFARRLETIK